MNKANEKRFSELKGQWEKPKQVNCRYSHIEGVYRNHRIVVHYSDMEESFIFTFQTLDEVPGIVSYEGYPNLLSAMQCAEEEVDFRIGDIEE